MNESITLPLPCGSINSSLYCFGNGVCLSDDSGNIHDGCFCTYRYETSTNCQLNFFEVYNGRDAYYYTINWIVCAYLLYKGMGEFMYYVVVAGFNRRWWVDAFNKGIFSLWVISRMISFTIWGVSSIKRYPYLTDLDVMLMNVNIVIEILGYSLLIVTWIDVLRKVKYLNESKQYYEKMKKGILILSFLLTPVLLVLDFLGNFTNPFFAYIHNVLVAIFAIPALTWCAYHSIRVLFFSSSIKSESYYKMKHRNKLFLLSNIGAFSLIITYGAYAFLNSFNHSWMYLGFMSYFKFTESILALLLLNIVKQNFRVTQPFANCNKRDNESGGQTK